MLSAPYNQWNWKIILECFLIAVTEPKFINIVADGIIYRLENHFSMYADRRSFFIPNLPINVSFCVLLEL